MSKTLPSPMMPYCTHDELAEQLFVVDLKKYIGAALEPMCRAKANDVADDVAPGSRETHVEVRREMEEMPLYKAWVAATKAGQDMMWESISAPVDRQIDELEQRADIQSPRGSVTTDPNFEPPEYIAAQDVHRMPGNYLGDFEGASVRQGVLYDCGGYIYNIGGRNGGHFNDARGHTLVSHIFTRAPEIAPKKILEMGCSAGNSTVAMASYFPEAEFHAIDVGASMVRYAHARAEHLDTAVHFSQQDAANTSFDDNSFDVVVSCVMIHETSHKAVKEIIEESYRVLKPGGLMVHLEVPARYEDLDVWGKIRGDYEMAYNHEPFWRGALTTDFEALSRDAGFEDIMLGFQDATRKAQRAEGVMRQESLGVHRSWMVFSGIKPLAE